MDNTIIDDSLNKDTLDATEVVTESLKSQILRARAAIQRQAVAAEVALKGMYVDWVFGKLNLTKYR